MDKISIIKDLEVILSFGNPSIESLSVICNKKEK
jgi:hypothetical protein